MVLSPPIDLSYLELDNKKGTSYILLVCVIALFLHGYSSHGCFLLNRVNGQRLGAHIISHGTAWRQLERGYWLRPTYLWHVLILNRVLTLRQNHLSSAVFASIICIYIYIYIYICFSPTALAMGYGVFANIGSGAVPGRLPGGRFREVPGITGSGRFEGSGAGSEPRVSGQVSGDRVPPGRFQNGSGQVSRL